MIEFQNVTISFNDDHMVLNDVSFSANFYEKIAILGISGGGKTTLIRLILGLVRPDAGRIFIDGQDITGLSESEMRAARMKFSVVFQEGALFDSLNVRENVVFCFREYSNLSEEEIEERARGLLSRLGIEQAIDLMPEELSGGMKRRVAIARALAGCSPRMVLYDEATSGLDPLTADNICGLINDLSQGEPPDRTGFIIVTHKVTDAVKVAERFIYLRDGRIVFDGGLKDLRNTKDPELRAFTGELHIAEKYL
ncbi:MAG: ATP-binding cassette domain-containing protein [Nitrospirota bacterium]